MDSVRGSNTEGTSLVDISEGQFFKNVSDFVRKHRDDNLGGLAPTASL